MASVVNNKKPWLKKQNLQRNMDENSEIKTPLNNFIAGKFPANNKLILVFNVIYPETIPQAVIEQLKLLDF
jgi:hypothetical protein